MSLRSSLWAMDSAPVRNPTAVLVLYALADEADDEGLGACPFIAKVAKRARCSERSAQSHIRDLFRARIIDLGDSGVAERRYHRAPGRAPRVWNLNLAATWDSIPEPRTDEEMVAEYSDQIGLRPLRRGADSAPLESEEPGGVQNLHPSDEEGSDQAIQEDVDQGDHDEGCNLLHPRGAATCTPGVQTAAPYPLVPAYTRTTSSSVQNLTRQDHSLPQKQEEADSDQEKPLNIVEIAAWFVGLRANTAPDEEPWTTTDVETVLATAVQRGLGPLSLAAQALRELVEGRAKYGPTRSPWRLLADTDPGCWAAVRPKAKSAAARRLAAEPRCPVHERFPLERCVPCMSEKLVAPEPEPEPDAKAEAEARAYVKAVRQRQRAIAGRGGGQVAAAS